MPVITITTEFSFDIEAIEDDVIAREVGRRKDLFDRLKKKVLDELPPRKRLCDFSDEDILAELDSRSIDPYPDVERLYRLIAAGENTEAMELLHRESFVELAPPSHEKRLADLLAGKRSPAHVQN